MTSLIRPHPFTGLVRVPASKSHTIRRLFIATMAEGTSEIINPLDSLDTRSCLSVCRALGSEITEHRADNSAPPNYPNPNPINEKGEGLVRWTVQGITGRSTHECGDVSRDANMQNKRCYVGNSGTTLFFGLAAASLQETSIEFDGDEQISRRSAGPLLDALSGLGVNVTSSAMGNTPITVRGPWKGGRVVLPCPTSQYLSALLLAAPLAPEEAVTEIDVPLLNERPYVEMTLSYLKGQKIPYKAAPDFSHFSIPGGSAWKPISGPIPGDFSSAAFPAAAAVISGNPITLLGLDPDDIQGDKAFFGFLEKMGCRVAWGKNSASGLSGSAGTAEWRLEVSPPDTLTGGEFDLNDTPDLLPVIAAIACFARGDTSLVNAASARIKETDRIAVMAEELMKLGVKTTEHTDALVIHGLGKNHAKTKTGEHFKTDGRKDHRVVMALACAALGCESPVEITGGESAGFTYPGFMELLKAESVI